ncbi:MAG: hypothetical protein ABI629_11685 [bacterium]
MTMTSRRNLPSRRLKVGAAVLAGAEVVDTKLVSARLRVFTAVQREYVEAQRKVEEADARLDAERRGLAELDAVHDAAVEQLAISLVNEGQPRTNPFAAFDADSPSVIKRLAPEDAARAGRALLTALSRSDTLSQASLEAGRRVEQATQRIEAALAPLQARQDEWRAARHMAEVIGQRFDTAVSALRRAARAAADDGAAALDAALVPPPLPRAAKKVKAPEVAAPAA